MQPRDTKAAARNPKRRSSNGRNNKPQRLHRHPGSTKPRHADDTGGTEWPRKKGRDHGDGGHVRVDGTFMRLAIAFGVNLSFDCTTANHGQRGR